MILLEALSVVHYASGGHELIGGEGPEVALTGCDWSWPVHGTELGILIYMHPLCTRELEPSSGLKGSGLLTNTIGNPLETTIALSHLMFEGTFDRFPRPQYSCSAWRRLFVVLRERLGCGDHDLPEPVGPLPKKKPTQYLKDGQLYFDSIMFTPEEMRHRIAETGVGRVVIGTDYPFP